MRGSRGGLDVGPRSTAGLSTGFPFGGSPPIRGRSPIRRSDTLVARNFAVLGLGDGFARILAFGASVYLARVLGADGYGVVALAVGIAIYLRSLVDFGVETLGIRRVASEPGEAGDVAGVFLTGRLAMAVVVAAIAYLGARWLLPPLEADVLALYLLTLVPVALSTRWVHLGLERTGAVAASRVVGEALVLALVLLTVHGIDRLWAVPVIQFLGDALAAAWLLVRLGSARVPIRWSWDPERLRRLAKSAWPLVGHSLLGLLIYNSDLLFLRAFEGRAEVGWYAVAYTLVSFMLNLGITYAQSLLPTLTRLDREGGDAAGLYHTALAQVFAVVLPVAVGGALVAGPLIDVVFGPDYGPSGFALSILLWSLPLSLWRSVAVVALVARERHDLVLRTTTRATPFNLLLNVALIPLLGIPGAAIATVLTEAARAASALVFARDLRFPGLPWRRCGGPLLAVVAMGLAVAATGDLHVLLRIPLGAAVYALGLLLTGGLRVRGGLRLDV